MQPASPGGWEKGRGFAKVVECADAMCNEGARLASARDHFQPCIFFCRGSSRWIVKGAWSQMHREPVRCDVKAFTIRTVSCLSPCKLRSREAMDVRHLKDTS